FPGSFQNRLPTEASLGFRIQQVTAFRLGLFGATASNAVPELVALLRRPDPYVGDKGRVIQALGNIGPKAKSAVPDLVRCLGHSNDWVRFTALTSLLQIGAVPPSAIPALKLNLYDTGYYASENAVALIAAGAPDEGVAVVRPMLLGKDDKMEWG